MNADYQPLKDYEQPEYSLVVDYMPDGEGVQCMTIRNRDLQPAQLGAFIEELETLFKPLKFIIVNERSE